MPHWPQLGVGAIVCHQGKILLVLRGREPARDQWAIPGGKVQPGESLQAAVEREILEETGIAIRAGELACRFEFIERDEEGALRYHYVVLDFFADYLSGEPRAGDDAADASWVAFSELESLRLNTTTRKALMQLFPRRFAGKVET
jgi:ADP-ribose pyrophosphatase